MDEMSSSEFRKRYASLTEQTMVTVNGHPIGVWLPGQTSNGEASMRHYDPPMESAVKLQYGKGAQAQRDDLLRKINRGK